MSVEMHVRKNLYCFEDTIGRNMDIKGASVGVSYGNKERYCTLEGGMVILVIKCNCLRRKGIL